RGRPGPRRLRQEPGPQLARVGADRPGAGDQVVDAPHVHALAGRGRRPGGRAVIRHALLAVLLAMIAVVPLGCASSDSSSDSSRSSIDSSTSPSRSSESSSDGGDSASDRYRDEVRTYTAGYARGGGLVNDAFKRQLAETAKRYSISNWEDK